MIKLIETCEMTPEIGMIAIHKMYPYRVLVTDDLPLDTDCFAGKVLPYKGCEMFSDVGKTYNDFIIKNYIFTKP